MKIGVSGFADRKRRLYEREKLVAERESTVEGATLRLTNEKLSWSNGQPGPTSAMWRPANATSGIDTELSDR